MFGRATITLSIGPHSSYPSVVNADTVARFMVFHKVVESFTSSTAAVAKYCDEYVCLCVCVCLSVCPRGFLRNHTAIFTKFLCMLPMSMVRSSSDMLTIGRVAYRREGYVTRVHSADEV